MKTKRIIFIVLGWLFIFINAAGWLAVIGVPNDKYGPNGIAETIGFNFWFVIGFILLWRARKQKKAMERKKEQQVLDNFLVK